MPLFYQFVQRKTGFSVFVVLPQLFFAVMYLSWLCKAYSSGGKTTESIVRTQCRAQCLSQFGSVYRRRLRNGSSYKQFRCDSGCQPCWYSCDSQSQTEALCKIGCDIYVSEKKEKCRYACTSLFHIQRDIIESHSLPMADWIQGGVEGVELICMSLQGDFSSPTVLGSFRIRESFWNDSSDPLPIVHYIEAKQRTWNEHLKQHLDTPWYRLGMRAEKFFTLKDMFTGFQYKFRVIGVHPTGSVGSFSEMMVEGILNAEVSWVGNPDYPGCFYHIAWFTEDRVQSRSFPIDESLGYLLSNLSYNTNYTVKMRGISGLKQPRLESHSVLTRFLTRDCLDSHNHSFAICGPGRVNNAKVEIVNQSAILKWMQPNYTTPWNPVLGFLVEYRSLPHLGYCLEHVEETVELSSNETELSIGPLSDGCYYRALIRAIGESRKVGVNSVLQFNFSLPKLLPQNGNRGSEVPFHPAYFLAVVGCFLVVVSVAVGVYIKVKKAELDVRKHPLTLQLSSLLTKALYRNAIYSSEAPSNQGTIRSGCDPRVGRGSGRAHSDSPQWRVHSESRISSVSGSSISSGGVVLHQNPAGALSGLVANKNYAGITDTPARPNEITMLRFLQCERVLGEGTFGKVYMAKCWAPGLPSSVAVKVQKEEGASSGHLKSELEVLESLDPHPQIVRFYGKCHMLRASREPDAIIMEYCPEGNLKEFLTRQRTALCFRRMRKDSGVAESPTETLAPVSPGLCPRRFLSFARQITLGMEYLCSKNLVHRDLAARNILVCEGGDVVKISDFGLTRREGTVMSGGQMPVKWMAPESLKHRIYTEHSDVWSFGVLLWEIVTVGGDPYPGVPLTDLFSIIESGYRMPKPEMSSSEIYELMLDCWVDLPRARPRFSLLKKRLERLLEHEGNYIHMDRLDVNAIYYKNLTDVVIKDPIKQ